ncbi:hypothetical protein KIH39_02050 [Telmatocola sphagniphila]|uniref:YcxB-like protein domain-containing protein n=1 Tax=Telmatocola sphagniphila TaxID=1123043 RepID=A0A8E6EVH5_9BACT|nr:hypothetical protein [Telmatocola sphagniphila]QVL32725.1 hypothetical protein KIH39_02050 [Telmatocola sphagniphila]
MKVTYQLQVEDLIAFENYIRLHVPEVRRHYYISVILSIYVYITILIGVFYICKTDFETSLFTGSLSLLVLLAILPEVHRNMIERKHRRASDKGEYASKLIRSELIISEDYLIHASENGVLSIKIEKINRIVSDGERTYIFFNKFEAFLLPHSNLEGDLSSLIAEISKRINGKSKL